MLHGVKRLVVMFFLLLVLMICGFSYYTYRQHKENAARVEQITQTMNKKVAKAKQASSNVVQESYKTSSTTDETQAALNALHASNGTELDKYKNEKYYALDKAIINNDAKAADAAVKAMGTDLAMNDRYRSTQAVSLLNQAAMLIWLIRSAMPTSNIQLSDCCLADNGRFHFDGGTCLNWNLN